MTVAAGACSGPVQRGAGVEGGAVGVLIGPLALRAPKRTTAAFAPRGMKKERMQRLKALRT